ncbi:MAG TPA: DUF6603 domain-containing protein [Solirubrobacteraceae bacterium]
MAGEAGTLELLARELATALQPLEDRLASGNAEAFITELGLRLPPPIAADAQLAAAISTTATAAGALEPAIEQLINAITADDAAQIVSAGLSLIGKLRDVLTGGAAIGTDLSAALAAAGGLTPAQQAELESFAAGLPRKLLDFTLVEYLRAKGPTIMPTLTLLGVVDDRPVPGDPADPVAPPAQLRAVHLDRLVNALLSPQTYLEAAFGFGTPAFDGSQLFALLQGYLQEMKLPVDVIAAPGQPLILEAYLLRLSVDPTASPPKLTFRLRFDAIEDFERTYPLGSLWNLALSAKARFDAGLEGTVAAPLQIGFAPPTGTVTVDLEIGLAAQRTGGTVVLFAEAGATKLEAQQISFTVGVTALAGTGGVSAEPSVSGAFTGGHLKIDMSGGDGFISTITGGTNIDANLDFKLQWSPSSGFQIEGSSAIQIAIPSHLSLGPIEVDKLYLQLGLSGGALPAELSGAFSANLGPLTASVDRIGLSVNTTFPDHGGNLGPADVSLAFKPPNGVGLSVDAGIVSGGGFLYIDAEHGQYAGALQLKFADFLDLSAIGLIDTRLPDGSSGFSLLIIITADFGAGIQLGFGFTLNAVGGLIGLNRAMLFGPLMDGVRSGSIDSIMFPQDVVANAPRIISDLRAIFPPQDGTFLIGPMAKLGWGEPTLVSLSLGVIIEIPPGDIAILGVLKVALPADELEILLLQVNFAGALEFDKQRGYFFASLYDSHILFITIEGEMGLLFGWGDNANFVLSVGGFHPQFNPPPLPFPTPRRVEVDIINESYARIRCDGYFAVTTNTVQFGAQSEYFFGFSACSVQGSSGFDALIQFSPFHFTVGISTSFSVKVFGIGVFGIDIDLTLDGPTPWHARGSGSLSFFFFSVSIPIDITFGDSRDTTLPPVAVMPILVGELDKRSNWKAVLPSGANLLVSLRKLDPSEADFVLHPVGTLQISQRAVPLDLTISKVGNQSASDANRFALTSASPDLITRRELQESFAPSQFNDYDDATKLSQAAFQPQDSGIELSAAGHLYRSGTAITRVVRYDLTIIDTRLLEDHRRFFGLTGDLFDHFLLGASVARSPLSAYVHDQTHPFDGSIGLGAEQFVVAHQADNTAFAGDATFSSQAAAADHLARTVAADPSLSGALHVLPAFEVAV